MLIRLGYEIDIECEQPTPVFSLLDICRERRPDIRKEAGVLVSPKVPHRTYLDRHGNYCRRLVAPAGGVRLLYDALVADSGLPDERPPAGPQTPVDRLPSSAIIYLLGSRYCETDHMNGLAWSLFGGIEGGRERVEAIVDYVHERMAFGYAYARSTRTAAQAHEERVGVCRDFAHLAITLCRCMNIPARYVNGYLGDIGVPEDPAPMDFSAWFEVYIQGGWYTYDARHNEPRIGRVVIARGRDATDVPLLHTFGEHRLRTFKVWTYEQERYPASHPPRGVDRTIPAEVLA